MGFFVVLSFLATGVLINTVSSDHPPPKTFDEVVDVVTDEYKEVKSREGFVSYKLND